MDNNDNDIIWDDNKHEYAVSPNKSDCGTLGNGINSSNCIEQFMELMNCKNLDAVSGLGLNFIQWKIVIWIYSQSKQIHVMQSTVVQGKGGGGGDAAVKGNDKPASPSGEPEQRFITWNKWYMAE